MEEKNTLTPKSDAPEILLSIYQQTDEQMRKQLFSTARKHQNGILKAIAKKIPGQRYTSIASRKGSIGQLIDKFLESPKNADLLNDLLATFMNNYLFINDKYIADHFVGSRITQGRFDAMLDQIAPDDPARNHISFCFNVGFHESDFQVVDDALEPVLLMLEKYFEISSFYQGDIGEIIRGSEDYSRIDQTILTRLDETNNLVVELISLVKDISLKHLGEKLSWNTQDELLELIDKIESTISLQLADNGEQSKKEQSSFLTEYIELLKSSTIQHSSRILQRTIEETRDRAVGELEEAFGSDASPAEFMFNIPTTYFDKLKTFSAPDIKKEQENLIDNGLDHLADLISMIEHINFQDIMVSEVLESPIPPAIINKEEEVIEEGKNSEKKNIIFDKPAIPPSHGSEVSKQETSRRKILIEKEKIQEFTEISWDKLFSTLDHDNPKESSTEIQQVVLHLIRRGYYGVAFHLMRSLEDNKPDGGLSIRSDVVRALSLSLRVNYRNTQLTSSYEQVINALDPAGNWLESDDNWTEFHRYLLCASAIWSGIAAPSPIHDLLLPNLNISNFPELSKLISSIHKFSKLHLSTDPRLLKSLHSHTEWDDEFKKMKKNTEEWLENARRGRLMYKPATQIWQLWINKGGCLSNFLESPIHSKKLNLNKFESELKSFDLSAQLELDEKSFLHHALEGKSKVAFLRRANEALERARKLLELIKTKPTKQNERLTGRVKVFEDSLKTLSVPILLEIKSRVKIESTPFQLKVGFTVLEKMLSDTIRFFIDHEEPRGAKDQLSRAERQELMLLPSLRLDSVWEFESLVEDPDDFSSLLRPIIESLTRYEVKPKEILSIYLENNDFLSARRLIEWAKSERLSEIEMESMQNKFEFERVKARTLLADSLNECENQLTRAGHNGLIQESLQLSSEGKLQDIIRRFDEGSDYEAFYEDIRVIEQIKQSFVEDKDALVKSVNQRIEYAKEKSKDAAEIQIVEKIAEEGSLHIANDYLDRIFDGQPLPIDENLNKTSHFDIFYLGSENSVAKIDTLATWFENKRRNRLAEDIVVKKIASGNPFAKLNYQPLPEIQRKTYAHALETWFKIKRLNRIPKLSMIEEILAAIGFTSVKAEYVKNGAKSYYSINTDPISSGTIARYGSEANGKYVLHTDFEESSPEQLISSIEGWRTNKNEAMILFYFDRMPKSARIILERECRVLRQTVIVIDDLLSIYLATIVDARISALLECTMPFTHYKPYTTTASILPPEMFYGRRHEIEKLESISGDPSFLLYGGRQIGKTVLLRHVQKKVNKPLEESIARFIDLKRFGIGLGKPIEQIWPRMVTEISKGSLKVFPDNDAMDTTPEFFSESIIKWLDQKETRRILLLLDEADGFLRADAENTDDPYYACTILKGIMEQTNRRFKIVLSGLHNVRKSTRVANNPIAHFGESLCIGPMIKTENVSAQKLVEVPLATMGIQFEDPELVIQVLAQANYYPNLIQIYCSSIMEYVTEKRDQVKPTGELLPYILKSVDLKNIYERKQLRESLRDRFRLTLDLDPRFKLLASILALFNDEKEEQGFTPEWIQEYALAFWEKGFSEPSGGNGTTRVMGHDDFINILDEMEGLGILRKTDDEKYYDLRSPNVVSLLGTKQYLDKTISNAASLELPEYSAVETLRSPLKQSENVDRSALTARQENTLKIGDNGIYLVIGTIASGLNDLFTSLSAGFFEEISVRRVKKYRVLNDVVDELAIYRNKRTKEGRNILLVPRACNWETSWIEAVHKELNILEKLKVQLSVVFIANGDHLWKHPRIHGAFRPNKVLTLSPWTDEAVRHWFNDTNLGSPDPDMREKIHEVSGFWPTMLYQLSSFSAGEVVLGDTIKEFEKVYSDENHVAEILKNEFEIKESIVELVFKTLATVEEPMQPADIVILSDSNQVDLDGVNLVLNWAEKLKYIRKHKGGWKLDSFLIHLTNMA